MRHVSLRVKINIAIFLAFLAAALAFGGILTRYMGARQAATQNRARMLLAAVAAHRLEALAGMLDRQEQLAATQDILDRVIRVDGVTEASLFDAAGTLLAFAGTRPPQSLGEDGGDQSLPSGRVFTVAASAADDRLTAALVEPVRNAAGRNIGYLRLAYSLGDISDLNHRTWVVFAAAVVAAYCLLAGLLNLLLHRLVLSPVASLRQGLEAVQAGRLGLCVPVRSQDAIGRMAMAFNAMSARLKETSEELARNRDAVEENRRLLARRVEERTAELARTNVRLTEEVAARREAEGRLQRALALYEAILEATAEGVVCVSPLHSGELLAYNRRFLELWGLPEDWSERPREERTQCFLEKFAAPEAARNAYEGLMGEETRQETAIVALRDGRFFERRTGPILLQNACIGRVFSYVDVTAEMQRQTRTEREKTQAEDASRAKSAFLAVMSHEIRTPLNVVIGLTEELLAGEASDEQRDHLRVIQQSAGHLLGVVTDVLDFSKIEAGKLVLERVDFRVRELVAGAADAFAREARRKGLDFSVLVAEEVPQFLCGDPGRLRQVLLNLLGNAVKFTELGAIALTVEQADPAAGPSGCIGLRIRVADTGIGIPQDRIANIFEEFQQGGGSISRRFGGTGLGLAICKGILARMDGTIGVESRPGKGSVFTCTAWLLPGRATADHTVEAPVGSAQRLRILLVEDNALNAAVARLHVTRMGHDLTVANSAAEAYALLAGEHFDAVLMDIEMPDVDGITATRVIRAGGPPERPTFDPGIPIIAVTAHAVEEVRQTCLEAGMNGFLTKPVNFQTLRQVLDQTGQAGEALPPRPPATPEDLFDPDAARKAMGIAWDAYTALARVAVDEGVRRLDEVERARADGDTERAIIAAHTLKSTAATIGSGACRCVAVTLEKALREGDAAAADKAFAALAALWKKLEAAFADWQPPQEK
jgi:signal transduction histidine kinase/DNA-binding NarL/FixJ family response regulator